MTDLFTFPGSQPNYRSTDPITSRDAGRSAQKFTGEHHQAILNILRRAGRPMACEEIADAMTFDYARGKCSVALDMVACGKRMVELEREMRLLERTPQQHTNRSGRKAFKYRIREPQPFQAAHPKPEPL